MGNGILGPHWVRYGIAGDQQYLLGDFAKTYDQLVVNANMLAHMPQAMSVFLAQKAQKQFVIDPQTHAFQHGVEYLLSTSKKSAGELKRSWRGLVERYGEPLAANFGGDDPRPLAPSDFEDQGRLREFCQRVIHFQSDTVTHSNEKGPDSKYLKFLAKKKGTSTKILPAMVVAPYFYLGGPTAEEWLDVNLQSLDAARTVLSEEKVDLPLAAELVISKESLADDDFVNTVVQGYSERTHDVLLLWIDDFIEQNATRKQLSRYVDLVSRLTGNGTHVVNLYGGFFSVAQAKFGSRLHGKLSAVCHGLEYGESKPVVPVSGGIPVAKYYSNSLHVRLPPRVAYQEIIARDALDSAPLFHQQVCSCPECRKHITKSPRSEFFEAYSKTFSKPVWRSSQWIPMQFPTAEVSDHCTRHYMWCKEMEYGLPETSGENVKRGLLDAAASLGPVLGGDYVGHARAWTELF